MADEKDPAKPFWDTSGDQFLAPLDALQVINALNEGKGSPFQLREGTTLASQTNFTITLGQAAGTRTYRMQIDASFDTSDPEAVADDVLAIYLADSNDLGETILDRGQPGTALFTLSPSGPEFRAGQVRWDGSVLEIDLSELASEDTGVLKLQLLGTDNDGGTTVVVRPLSNVIDPEGVSGPFFPLDLPAILPGAEIELTELSPVDSVDGVVSNIRFDETTGRFVAEVVLQNLGQIGLGRKLAVAFPNLPAGVTLLNESGATRDGTPYLNWHPAMPPGGLGRGERAERLLVEFDVASQTRFAITPQVLAGPNAAPNFESIGPLTTTAGATLTVPLSATDSDGDPITFAISSEAPLPTGILKADGTLVFSPQPDQLGDYEFTLIASDGSGESRQDVTLSVIADLVTTTRVSGFVLL